MVMSQTKLSEKQILRFWSYVEIGDGCWNWCKCIKPNGYGQVNINNKKYHAHRIAYQIYFGELPGELLVCHRCDNRLCCNPSHLFLGTHQDNSDDKLSKGRSNTGERQGNSKLTSQVVHQIRSLKITGQEASKRFGISPAQVSRIRTGKHWAHLGESHANI